MLTITSTTKSADFPLHPRFLEYHHLESAVGQRLKFRRHQYELCRARHQFRRPPEFQHSLRPPQRIRRQLHSRPYRSQRNRQRRSARGLHRRLVVRQWLRWQTALLRLANSNAYGGGFSADTGYFPWKNANPVYTYRDNVTKIVGNHTSHWRVFASLKRISRTLRTLRES